MKKFININIILALTTVLIIGYILSIFFPLYQFHTFNKQAHYDVLLANGDFNNVFTFAGLDLYQDSDSTICQGGKITVIVDDNFTSGNTYNLKVVVNDSTIISDYDFQYDSTQREYSIEIVSDVALPSSIDKATVTIYDDFDQVVASENLVLTNGRILDGYNRVMRLENVALQASYIRLGQLSTTMDLSGYDSIALEYRYLTSDDLDPGDNNSYTVFEKIEGTPDQILSGTNYDIHYFTVQEKEIPSRPLSVAVIMKKGDQSEVVKIDLD